ncbi:hypothetical protein C8J56DRAFT_439072 [Mycena floridula]|nr:hypothetical protein C8J56DRAFT_439072 [Mycena floridula]
MSTDIASFKFETIGHHYAPSLLRRLGSPDPATFSHIPSPSPPPSQPNDDNFDSRTRPSLLEVLSPPAAMSSDLLNKPQPVKQIDIFDPSLLSRPPISQTSSNSDMACDSLDSPCTLQYPETPILQESPPPSPHPKISMLHSRLMATVLALKPPDASEAVNLAQAALANSSKAFESAKRSVSLAQSSLKAAQESAVAAAEALNATEKAQSFAKEAMTAVEAFGVAAPTPSAGLPQWYEGVQALKDGITELGEWLARGEGEESARRQEKEKLDTVKSDQERLRDVMSWNHEPMERSDHSRPSENLLDVASEAEVARKAFEAANMTQRDHPIPDKEPQIPVQIMTEDVPERQRAAAEEVLAKEIQEEELERASVIKQENVRRAALAAQKQREKAEKQKADEARESAMAEQERQRQAVNLMKQRSHQQAAARARGEVQFTSESRPSSVPLQLESPNPKSLPRLIGDGTAASTLSPPEPSNRRSLPLIDASKTLTGPNINPGTILDAPSQTIQAETRSTPTFVKAESVEASLPSAPLTQPSRLLPSKDTVNRPAFDSGIRNNSGHVPSSSHLLTTGQTPPNPDPPLSKKARKKKAAAALVNSSGPSQTPIAPAARKPPNPRGMSDRALPEKPLFAPTNARSHSPISPDIGDGGWSTFHLQDPVVEREPYHSPTFDRPRSPSPSYEGRRRHDHYSPPVPDSSFIRSPPSRSFSRSLSPPRMPGKRRREDNYSDVVPPTEPRRKAFRQDSGSSRPLPPRRGRSPQRPPVHFKPRAPSPQRQDLLGRLGGKGALSNRVSLGKPQSTSHDNRPQLADRLQQSSLMHRLQ